MLNGGAILGHLSLRDVSVPQRAVLAHLLGLSRLLAALRTRGEQLSRARPNGRLRCGREGRPKGAHPAAFCTPRRSASRLRSTTSATARATFTTATSRPPWRCSYRPRSRPPRRWPSRGPSTRGSPRSSSSELSCPSCRRAVPCAAAPPQHLRCSSAAPPPHAHHTPAARTRQRWWQRRRQRRRQRGDGSGGSEGGRRVWLAWLAWLAWLTAPCRLLSARAPPLLWQVLGRVEMRPDQVDELVLVGGSTRMAKARATPGRGPSPNPCPEARLL